MSLHFFSVKHNVSFNSIRFFFVLQLLLTSFSAHASYTWVMGSFKSEEAAAASVSDARLVKIGAVSVRSRSPEYARRILAGCFDTREEAMKKRGLYASASNSRGIWLLRSGLACHKAAARKAAAGMNGVIEAARNAGDAAEVAVGGDGISASFRPKRWKYAGGNKVAFTDGENPAFFYTGDTCRVIVYKKMTDIADVEPPSDRAAYFFNKTENDGSQRACKIAFVYEVQK